MATRGVIPVDLSEQPVEWRADLDSAARVALAQGLLIPPDLDGPPAPGTYPEPVLRAALAITLIEQPGKVPCNNAVGLMPWTKLFPWGWALAYWLKRPTGYFLCHEGCGSGMTGIFFAFADYVDSFRFLCEVVQMRRITDGDGYAEHWGGGQSHDGLVALFDKGMAEVATLWPPAPDSNVS